MRLKTKKNRTVSQKRWLERQLNDPYVARARREGLRSRAAYKLIEIDDKYRLLKPGGRVVDLGAAPGGWSEVAANRVGAAERKRQGGGDRHPRHGAGRGRRVPQARLPRRRTRRSVLHEMLGGGADVVLSDMAANATGHKKTDQLKIMALVEAGAEFAREVLRPGGSFLTKVLQGGTDAALLAGLKRDFASVKHVKPQASRADSSELYLPGERGVSAGHVNPPADPTHPAPRPAHGWRARRRHRAAATRTAAPRSAAIAPTTRKAGWKSAAVMIPLGPATARQSSTASAPTATPAAIESCCATLTSEVARLIRRGSTSA